MKRRRAAAAFMGLLAAASVGDAHAHGKSYSYSSWKLDAVGASVELRIPARELAWLPAARSEAALLRYLPEHLELGSGGGPCAARGSPRRLPAPPGWIRYAWRIDCPEGGAPTALRSTLLADVAPSHLHFAKRVDAAGHITERVLAEGDPEWAFASPEPERAQGASLLGYLALGVLHIASGFDHLAFVLALLLLASSFGEVATLVSGFTVAHSLTLALATLGVVRPEAAAVEALIGLSIALVALENGWLLGGRGRAVPRLAVGALLVVTALSGLGMGRVPPLVIAGVTLFAGCHFALLRRAERPARLRAGVALTFGLVHGFGFAGILTELELPRARLAAALLGFNLGVELGQLAVVALAWPVLRWLAAAQPGSHRVLVEACSAGVLALGLYWFLQRAFGA